MTKLAPGAVIDDDLTVNRHVASGGMGDVYECFDSGLGRRVAVKVLRSSTDDDATAPTLRALREGRATARVVHPGVVAIHRVGRVAGAPMLIMEWVDGPTLREALSSRPLPALAIHWLLEVVDAVAAAHDAGVLHCDLKPENILLAAGDGERRRAKVVDFGLARGATLPQRSETVRNGTRAYLPADALTAPANATLDVFALGVIACELLCGQRPGRSGGVVSVPRRLSLRLREVVARALDADANVRHRDARALQAALIAAARGDGLVEITLRGDAASQALLAATLRAATLRAVPTAGIGAQANVLADRAALRGRVQAAFALVADVDEALIDATFGPASRAICDSLRADGWLRGEFGGLSPVEPALAQIALAALAADAQRALCASLGFALEACGRTAETWGQREAVGLWLRGDCSEVAAERVAEQARLSPRLRDRDRGLARALALLEASPASPIRVALLLERAEDAARAGWADVAREAVVEASQVAADLGLGADDAAARRCRMVEGELGLLIGDFVGARRRFLQVAGSRSHASLAEALAHDAVDDLTVHACARALVAAAAAATATVEADTNGPDSLDVVCNLIPPLLARFGTTSTSSPVALRRAARVHEGVAHVRVAQGQPDAALAHLRAALGFDLERGDALDAATVALMTAELRCAHDPRAAATLAADVHAMLSGQGLLRTTVRLDLLHAHLALIAGDAFAAARRAAVAACRAEALNVAPDAVAAWTVVGRAAEALHDERGAWEARQACARWTRRARRQLGKD